MIFFQEGILETLNEVLIVVAILTFIGILSFSPLTLSQKYVPFGSSEDVQFSGKLWKAIDGHNTWLLNSDFYPGYSPHGEILNL